jgi:hypothetical protein
VKGVIQAAGVSPTQAAPETILKVGLYDTALVLEEFGNVIAPGDAAGVPAPFGGEHTDSTCNGSTGMAMPVTMNAMNVNASTGSIDSTDDANLDVVTS